MMHDYGTMGFYGFGFIFMLLFWGLIFYIIYWVINSNKFNCNKNIDNLTPKEILKKRLANGDITKKEFHDILKELEK